MSNFGKQSLWQRAGLFFYTKKRLTALLFVAFAGFGLLSYGTLMKREGFPNIDVPIGVIQVISFDGGAQNADAVFAVHIAETAKQHPSIKNVTTTASAQGVSAVLEFREGTDVQSQLDEIKSELTPKFPAGARVAYVKLNAGKLTREGDDILVSVHSNESDVSVLDTQAKKVAERLRAVSDDIEAVHVFPSIEAVTDPVTGTTTERQIRFDRFYEAADQQIKKSVLVGVQSKQGTDQVRLYDQINAYLDSDEFTSDEIEAEISANFAEGITEQISGLQRNLLEGLAVVLVVSFILISLRSSVATAVSMAATVLITVGILNLIGYSLNTITLFSLILCLALIVDDMTIVVEAIDAGLKRGGKFREVVVLALGKVSRASATGTLTTMLAFAPMLFIGGILGKFVRAIPITIIISLAVSITVSFIFVPLIIRLTYGQRAMYTPRKFNIAGKTEEMIGGALARLLLWTDLTRTRRIVSRIAAVTVGIVSLVGGGLIFRYVGFNIFPAPKDGIDIVVNAEVVDKESADIVTTQRFADDTLGIVKQVVGNDLERISLTGNGSFADQNGFGVAITISPIGARDRTSVEVAKELQAALDQSGIGLRFNAGSAGVGPPAGSFTAQINAEDVEKAYTLASDLKSYLEAVELRRPDGTAAVLKDISQTPKVSILRKDGIRVLSVSGGFSDKDTSLLVSLAQEAVEKEFNTQRLASYGLSGDVLHFDFGQEEENQESFASMGRAAGPLFLAMFVVMALLFRSLLQPLLILLALPFAIIGVASGLFLSDNDISFFSMLGVFALIGISLNNTILLTDYANQASGGKKRPSTAMAEAIRERLRPLLTTSATSIFALLPLALNDPFWEGLAYTLMFGLISSTVLVLLVFPYFYLINQSLSSVLSRLWGRVVKTKRA